MRLVLKLPQNKPPFIGILFENEETIRGEKLHTEIVERYPHCTYEIVFEHTRTALNLRLLCQERVMVYFYNHLGFDAENLKSWLYFTREAQAFTFGHIERVFDKDKLILSLPLRKKFFVNVKSVKFIVAEVPDSEWEVPFRKNSSKW
ncbi:MAG: hypothetical protein IT236_04345 [Bacteroidia bacterium]|nr:hypothetical protein [Bacteroidia bacterium]